MIRTFPNDIISNYFKEIRFLLYKADGRTDLPPDDPFDFKHVNSAPMRRPPYQDLNLNSKIAISPTWTFKDVLFEGFNFYDIDAEVKEYNNNFSKLPFDIVKTSEIVEIDFFFYLYSLLWKHDPPNQSVMNFYLLDNFAMHRSDYLYKMIVRKFENFTINYQKCLKEARKYFQLNKKIDEEIVINNLIHFYSDILKADNKQLSLFTYVTVSKKIADLYSKILAEYFTLRLNSISSEIDKFSVAESEGQETVRKIDEKVVYELPENFSLTELGIKAEALDIKSTTIIWDKFRKRGGTINYSDKAYSELVHYLTGHSANNLRQKSGFGNIIKISRETRKGVKYYNLKKAKEFLLLIISDIDKEMNN